MGPEDYKALEAGLGDIRRLARLTGRCISLYDIKSGRFLLKEDRHLALLGYPEGQEMPEIGEYHALVHPDDICSLQDSELRMYDYLRPIDGEAKKDYKLVYEFRLRKRDGSYMRFLHQLSIFQLDRRGRSWIMLVISDALPHSAESRPARRFLLHAPSQRVCLFNAEAGIAGHLISRREGQVLGLVAQGRESRDIAEDLCISQATVNNHRQNILRKTRTRNMAEALAYLKCLGLA